MEYKDLEIDDIIKWCQEHNQVEWLKAKVKEEVDCKVYPRIKVKRIIKGKEKVVSVADKTQEPKIEKRPISFVQIKKDFRETFLLDVMPKKTKKPTMYDIIANL